MWGLIRKVSLDLPWELSCHLGLRSEAWNAYPSVLTETDGKSCHERVLEVPAEHREKSLVQCSPFRAKYWVSVLAKWLKPCDLEWRLQQLIPGDPSKPHRQIGQIADALVCYLVSSMRF